MESHNEQIARVEMMAGPDSGTWDLSDNDVAAIKTVLKERAELLTACVAASSLINGVLLPDSSAIRHQILKAIANAEGRIL